MATKRTARSALERSTPNAARHQSTTPSSRVSWYVSALVRLARLPRKKIKQRRRPTAKLVLLALADRADHHGSNAWPSVATICAESEASEHTIEACLEALKRAKLIRQ